MNRVSAGLLFLILIGIYLLIFIKGNYVAADRSSYLNIFMLNYSNRIEPGFVMMVRFLRLLLRPDLALNLYAVILFVTAYSIVCSIVKDLRQVSSLPIDFHFYNIFILFLVFSVFLFVQIRAGLVVYLSSFLIHLYRTKRSSFALPALLSLTLVHYMALPIFAMTITLYTLRLNNIILATSSAILLGFLPLLMSKLIPIIGLNPYYSLYFTGQLVNSGLMTSPSIIILYILLILALLISPKFVFGIKFFLPTFSIVFASAFWGLDVVIKSVSPFILLSWLYFYSRFRDNILNLFSAKMHVFAMFALAAMSMGFSLVEYG